MSRSITPFAQVNRAGEVAFGPFEIFARVYEDEFFAGVEALFDFAVVDLLDARLGVFARA